MSDSEKRSSRSKAVDFDDEEEANEEPTSHSAMDVARHIGSGLSEMMIKHLNGFVLALSHFLEEREKAHKEDRKGGKHTLRHLSSAHRKYKTHTHHASADLMDHVLEYEPKKKTRKRKKPAEADA